MRRLVGSVVGGGTVAVLVGLSLAAESFALPPARPPRRAAAREADDAVARAMEGEADEAAGDDDAADRAAADDDAPDGAAAAPAKGRPGVKQIEAPEAVDDALQDPEAARRAQFGDIAPFVFPGMAIPGFPQGAFPFVPPGAGAAAGNGAGVGVVQQFGFTGVVVGGNAVPGGNGFVVRTFQIGPDGAVKEVPQPEPPAVDRGQREPGKAKAKANPKPNAKPKDAAAAERAAGKAKAPAARDDDAKGAKAPRAQQNAKAPRAAAAGE